MSDARPPPPRFDGSSSRKPVERADAGAAPGGAARARADASSRGEDASARADAGDAPALGKTYDEPAWGGTPSAEFALECIKGGTSVSRARLDARADGTRRSWVSFGRHPTCDIVVEHPSTSRLHCVIQFKRDSTDAYVYDCGSAHGTFVNKRRIKPGAHAPVRVGDHIKLGESSRTYVLEGDAELMPEEGLSAAELRALEALERAAEEETRRELAKLKAEREAARAEEAAAKAGSSWGMVDADEEIAERQRAIEELDWRTHEGKLSEKQVKQRDNILRKEEKMANMRLEVERIRAKESQQEGGLSAGQTTRLSSIERAMETLQEEIEDADESLNESLRVSLGLQGESSKRRRRGAKGSDDEEDGGSGDDDDFYDRSRAGKDRKRKKNAQTSSTSAVKQTLETATTLWDKRIALEASIEETKELIAVTEEAACAERQRNAGLSADGDTLDAYMDEIGASRFTAQVDRLRVTLADKVSELERISRLLKYADPTEEFRPGSTKGDVMRRRAEEAEAKRAEETKRRAEELEAKRAEELEARQKRDTEARRQAEWERQGNVQEKRKFTGAGEAPPEQAKTRRVEVDEDAPVVVETDPPPARSPSPPPQAPPPTVSTVKNDDDDDDDGFLMPDQIRAGLEIRKRPAAVAPAAPEPTDAERAARDDVARLLAAATRTAAPERDDTEIEPIDAVPRSSSDAQAALAKRLGY